MQIMSCIMERATAGHIVTHRNAGMLYATALVAVTILLMMQGTAGQTDCGASKPCVDSSQCCSKYNYCGISSDHCGTGCQNGPCTGGGGGGGGSGWSSFFTQSVFEQYFPNRNQAFYTYQALQTAAQKYSAFGTTNDLDSQKREVAAFCANVKHESGGLVFIEETNPQSSPDYPYCDSSHADAPCTPGKAYYGRGPIQLSWNYNYNDAGNALGITDLLQNPDQVAQDGNVAFQTSLWFWMSRGPHEAILGGSFSETIRKINSMECGKGPGAEVQDRVQNYKDICSILGVDPGSDLTC